MSDWKTATGLRQGLRVLIVEDNPADAELVMWELTRAGFEPSGHRVETESEYLANLETEPEIVLADYNLPRFSALRALQLLRERRLDIPFVVVSGTIGEEAAVAMMRQGAADYLLKNHLEGLGRTVTRALQGRRSIAYF